MSRPKSLVTIPTYLREPQDVDVTLDAVKSIRNTAGDSVDVLLVDDGSPERELVNRLSAGLASFDADLHRKSENSGFSRTVNVGLRQALQEDRDAVLMNADVEIITGGWPRIWRATKDDRQQPAAVAGALLCFPNGLIQHAGVYFSLLTRTFDHMFKYGPMNLPEALRPRACPVTAAFQFIRHETLTEVGIYDESFSMGWEDVDFCLRVMLAGKSCVYTPNVRAWHYEMMFRGRPSPKVADWQARSWYRLAEKYRTTSFAELVPYW